MWSFRRRSETRNGEMPARPTRELGWALNLFDRYAPYLAVIPDDRITRLLKLLSSTPDLTLQGIHHILEPIVHVDPVEVATDEVQANAQRQVIGFVIDDVTDPFRCANRCQEALSPCKSRR